MVRLCGPLVVNIDGRAIESRLPSRQGRMVFAYLVLHRARPVSRDELIEALWPRRGPSSPETLLTALLSRLRGALPRGALEGRRQLSLRLAPDAWVDVEVVEGALTTASDALAAGDPAAATDRAQAALEILQLPLLPDLDRPWVDEHRRRLDDVALALLELVARAAMASGDPRAAQTAARRLIERDPLRESAYVLLMEAHAGRGDVAHAVRVYEELRTLLRDELGTIPGAPARALSERLLRDAEASAAPSTPVLPPPLARTDRPLGRDAALARLERAWSVSASGRLGVALVAGEAGIGKTTLIGELARLVHGRGAAVLYGRCDAEAVVPYQPWVEALERHVLALPRQARDRWLEGHGGALLRLLPGLAPGVTARSPEDQRYVVFEAVRALLEEAAAARPLLLVIDDLHWADPASLQLLRHVTGLATAAPVLVAACAREDELTGPTQEVLVGLRADRAFAQLTLTGLDAETVGELVSNRTGAADRPLAERLRERTGGNPFFLDELLRDREERGEAATGPPPGVQGVVSRRVARLGPDAQATLSVAAVAGQRFDLGVVASACGQEVAATLEALDGAVDAALVVPAGAPGRYAFGHALIVETLLASMPPSRRAALHLRVADALTGGEAAGRAGQVAWHLREAGPLVSRARLVAAEVAAAREAASALAYEKAARHYEAAVAGLAGEDADAERTELLLSLGDAHDRAGRREAARTAFRDAARLARRRGDWTGLARAALGHGGLAVVIAAPDSEVTLLLEEALAAVPSSEPATLARLLARLAVELSYGAPARAGELSRQAVAAARAAGDQAALAAALHARRVALWSPAQADERLATATAMITAARASADREAVLLAGNWRVVDLLELGRLADARAEVDAYDALTRDDGLPHHRWYVPLWRACLAMLAGRWDELAALGDEALSLGRRADDPNAPLLVRLQRVHALAHQRRFADVDRAWVAERAADPLAGVAWKAGLALLDAQLGDADNARRLVAELTAGGRPPALMNANWHAAGLLAEAVAQLGDRRAAAVLHGLLAPHAHLFPVVARGVACYGSSEYFTGRLAATLGRLDEAEARLRRAVRANERAGAAPRAVLALASLGEVLVKRRSLADAREALREAAERADALDMPVLVAQVADALDAC